MKKLLFVLLTLASTSLIAQLPGNFQLLYKLKTHRDSVFANRVERELITDMVTVGLTDSILPTKTSTHQTRLFNWMLRTFAGLRWRAIDGKKHAMVGTLKGGMSTPTHDSFTEYDVTFQTFQHTPKYQALVKLAYQAQRDKMRKGRNFLKKKGVNPDSLTAIDLAKLRIHPEHTPLKKNRDSLNKYFLPCLPGTNIDNHPAWSVTNPTVGCYGAFVLDGNHKGSPEIHPYEWLWWIDTKERTPNKVVWYAGLMREGSNRFLRWSKKPRVGFIKIPFVFDVTDTVNTIKIEHLVVGDMKPEALKKLGNYVPDNAYKFGSSGLLNLSTIYDGSESFPYSIKFKYEALNTDAVRWWFTTETDNKQFVWGYLNIAVSTDDVYAIRVTMED
jgi:hypothetical protein